MALIAVAADKGAPGVTTTAVALAAVWPRPVLLAECDAAGGDLVYRLPSADGRRLDPRRGLLSLAVAARRGLEPRQVWEHVQKLRGGLDVLVGVTNAEQGAGLDPMWGQVGAALAGLPDADVIADCGRVGSEGRYYDLLASADAVVMITRASLGDLVRIRDRVAVVDAAVRRRTGAGRVSVLVIANYKRFSAALGEVKQVLSGGDWPALILGGIAYEPRSADLLSGEWGGKLDKSLLIRTAREVAGELSGQLPAGRPAAVMPPAPPSAPAPPPISSSAQLAPPPAAQLRGEPRSEPRSEAPPWPPAPERWPPQQRSLTPLPPPTPPAPPSGSLRQAASAQHQTGPQPGLTHHGGGQTPARPVPLRAVPQLPGPDTGPQPRTGPQSRTGSQPRTGSQLAVPQRFDPQSARTERFEAPPHGSQPPFGSQPPARRELPPAQRDQAYPPRADYPERTGRPENVGHLDRTGRPERADYSSRQDDPGRRDYPRDDEYLRQPVNPGIPEEPEYSADLIPGLRRTPPADDGQAGGRGRHAGGSPGPVTAEPGRR